jgi:DNA modification methylase
MSEAKILVGDVRQQLSHIADGSVQCCVTSPPYWGLRDYGADGQIGLEQTPEAYVAEMVAVFREVWRVLRDDGVLWLNLGDSYSGSGKGRNADGSANVDPNSKQATSLGTIIGTLHKSTPDGLKPKDLVGIPWRVAFALQADGWYLRQDIIWAKPNPMPESVTDRCTKAHEYLFMLTKSARYYFDNDAIREPSVGKFNPDFKPKKKDWREIGWPSDNDGKATKTGNPIQATNPQAPANGRNKRSVWTITTKPFRGAHFAVMPEALVEPCVLASSRPNELVLDPFTGSGTVGVVALKHGRNFIGTELNAEYAEIARTRIESSQPMFNNVTIENGVTS